MSKEIEIRRKALHLVLGIILVTLIYYGYIDKIILGVATIIAFILLFISRSVRLPFIGWLLDRFERREDKLFFPGKGPLFYLIGAELSLVFFPNDIALAAIMVLAVGDSIPNIVGMYFGKIRHPFSDKKYMEAAAVGIILAALGAHIFVTWYEALVAAIIAIFVEGVDLKIDDNLVVPMVAGVVIVLIRLLL